MVEIEIVNFVFYAFGIFALGLVVGVAFGFVIDTISMKMLAIKSKLKRMEDDICGRN